MSHHLPRPRPVAAVAAGVLVMVAASGCSDVMPGDTAQVASSSTAPDDATPQAFCSAYGTDGGLSPDADADDLASTLKADAASLSTVGTPQDIPTQAREGFAVYVASTSAATSDEAPAVVGATSAGQLSTALGLTGDDARSLEAFRAYVVGTCFATP